MPGTTSKIMLLAGFVTNAFIFAGLQSDWHSKCTTGHGWDCQTPIQPFWHAVAARTPGPDIMRSLARFHNAHLE